MGYVGRKTKAKYTKQRLKEYQGNPFIEVLGPIVDEEQIQRAYTELPERIEQIEEYSLIEQGHLIERVKNFRRVLIPNRKVALKISTMIRSGYMARDFKNEKEQLALLRRLNQLEDEVGKTNDVEKVTQAINKLGTTTVKSTLLVGVSGCGKTTTAQIALNLFDQVIIHEEYEGRPFTRTQLVYIKFDCAEDGSLIRLCRNFFEAVDEVLGTNYTDKYALTTRNISELLFRMHRIAIEHAIGLLVIDEIQNIATCKDNKERMEVLNFIVGLSNNVGIPTLFIGTPEIYQLCGSRIAVIRRIASDEEISIGRMEKDSDEWDSFIEELWQYQYLKTYTPLDNNLKNLMYKHTQGIIAEVLTLYACIQNEALYRVNQKITRKLVELVAKNRRGMYAVNRAIESGKKEKIRKYSDIDMDVVGQVVSAEQVHQETAESLRQQRENQLQIINAKRDGYVHQLMVDMNGMGIFDKLDEIEIKDIASSVVMNNSVIRDYLEIKQLCAKMCMEKNMERQEKEKVAKESKVKQKKTRENHKGLLYLYDIAEKRKVHPKEVLEENECIKNPVSEFLLGAFL